MKVFYIIVIVVSVYIISYALYRMVDARIDMKAKCDAAGGVVMRSYDGVACYKVKKIPLGDEK